MTSNQEVTIKPLKLENNDPMVLLEAALYVTGKPLEIKTLGTIIGTRSKKKVKSIVKNLIKVYRERNGALELIELNGERFVLQLKPRYLHHVKRLAMRPLLSKGPLKTLAYIAYNQPVVQTKVIAIRGSHAYGHIKKIRDFGLITTETFGKTKLIRTTDVFADYFDLSYDLRLMKQQLKSIFNHH